MGSVKSQVKSFAEDNDKKLEILERVVEYEEENEPSNAFENKDVVDESDWKPGSDIGMPPSYIGMFKSAPFIDVVFDSRSSTVLCLSDLDETKQAIQELKDKPDEWSGEWLENQLGGNKIDEALSDVTVTEEDKEKIESIVESGEPLDYWAQYVAPDLKYRRKAKKAILIMLASPQDKHGNKGRVNVLAYGPPGTGKTVIKNYLVETFGAESIDGPRVSKSDITYNKNTDEFGQLPKAHKGILVVEESDEMDEQPLGAALTSLGESGEVEIRDKTIPAEAQGVFLSNFNSVEAAQSQWSMEAVNRFDFKIQFDELTEEQKNDTLNWHYEHFRKPKSKDNKDLFMKYLKLCRAYTPEMGQLDEIQEYKRNNLEDIGNIREGLSIMNIAWIIARLDLSDVTVDHYKKAYKLLK
jgi:uncharacterized protein YozE (UPF0346 family)